MRMSGAALALCLLTVACDGCGASATAPDAPSAAPPKQSAPVPLASAAPRPSASAPPKAIGKRLASEEQTWVYDSTPVGPMQVVVRLPERGEKERFPVLIAMHGRGEAHKGPKRGARGWFDDYALGKAIERLHAPPLTKDDLQGFADDKRLAQLNASLDKTPYRGLIIVCPYTPDILAGDKPFSAAVPLARFLVEEVLPRVREETPALEATGVDGVSLGGRASILVGLERPEAFAAVSSLQAAFDSADASELARRAKVAMEKNPKLALRLLTSDGDFFLGANRAISSAFHDAGVRHQLIVIPGPHDYPFNRGPGAYEMLLYHDRALRGEATLAQE